jgi:hypothetical protein
VQVHGVGVGFEGCDYLLVVKTGASSAAAAAQTGEGFAEKGKAAVIRAVEEEAREQTRGEIEWVFHALRGRFLFLFLILFLFPEPRDDRSGQRIARIKKNEEPATQPVFHSIQFARSVG